MPLTSRAADPAAGHAPTLRRPDPGL